MFSSITDDRAIFFDKISYNEFLDLIKNKQVQNLVISDKYIRGDYLKEGPNHKLKFLRAIYC